MKKATKPATNLAFSLDAFRPSRSRPFFEVLRVSLFVMFTRSGYGFRRGGDRRRVLWPLTPTRSIRETAR